MTDKELDELLQSLEITIDTREKNFIHITNYFDKRCVAWKREKLDTGDYGVGLKDSALIPVFVERKKNLDELIGNLTHGRARFIREMERLNGAKMLIIVEESSYADLVNGNYRSQVSQVAINSSIMMLSARYNVEVIFLADKTRTLSPIWILTYLRMHLREEIKNHSELLTTQEK